MENRLQVLLCPPDATAISYNFLRHLGYMLDELSSQGLEVWPDEHQRWQWRWASTELQSARGFWALGEAVVDAVATRYPAAFDREAIEEIEPLRVSSE